MSASSPSSGVPPSSIVKEGASGRVETIDALHPTSTSQLGRSLDEVSPSDKSNDVGPSPFPQSSEVLDVPPTSASTSLLVDGGKTEDPRHMTSPQLEVDPTQADAHTRAMEAEARGEAERLRESQKTVGAGGKMGTGVSVGKEKVSHLGLTEKSAEEVEREKQEMELKAKYPQIEL